MSPATLSRLAELIYWMGRYVERADDTSRVIDAYIHRMAEDPLNPPEVACRSLFAILGVAPEDGAALDPESVERRLIYDVASRSSVAGAVVAAHENARRAREALSSEMWVCLNATRHALAEEQGRAAHVGPASFLTYVRDRSALFAGLADATISRDDTWWYLVLGRSLERMDMIARLVEGRLVAAEHAPDWLTLLRAAGAMESYLRSNARGSDPRAIAAFLILNREFPRSAYHSLAVADHCLAELSRASSSPRALNRARGTIRLTQTMLEYRDPETLLDDLAAVVGLLQSTSARANDEITATYFRQVPAIAWASEEGT